MIDMLKGRKNGRFLEPFLLTPAMIWLFVELRDALMKALVLVHFDPARPIRLEIDTSDFAIAGNISQQQYDACNSAKGPARLRAPSSKAYWHPVAAWS